MRDQRRLQRGYRGNNIYRLIELHLTSLFFFNHSFNWCFTGTCKSKTCSADEYSTLGGMQTEAPWKECRCTGMVTTAQTDALRAGCNTQAETAFTDAGGSASDWAEAQTAGATSAAANATGDCFDTQMASANLATHGTCGGAACMPDPTGMVGMFGMVLGTC